jgi:ADP-ribose pyrophosphatase
MMERVGSEIVHEGRIATVRVDTFRAGDGSEYEREVVGHPGAVAIVAHDDERVFLVRQPREAVGVDDLLELPAGKLDVEGETPLDCARRELEEEAGVRAAEWREVKSFYTSPGFAEEEVTVFFATGLERVEPNPDEGEDLEIVEFPLAEIDAAVDACADAKSLVGLLLLRRTLGD